MSAGIGAIAGAQRHARQAQLGGTEADQVVVFGKPGPALPGGDAGAVRVAGASARSIARQPRVIPAPRRSPISCRRARLRSSSARPRSKSPLERARLPKALSAKASPCTVAELLEAGKALLDQLFRVGEIGLGAIHAARLTRM